MNITNMNWLYNVEVGSRFYIDGEYIGVVSFTRMKYGNEVVQVGIHNDDGRLVLINCDEDYIHQNEIYVESA